MDYCKHLDWKNRSERTQAILNVTLRNVNEHLTKERIKIALLYLREGKRHLEAIQSPVLSKRNAKTAFALLYLNLCHSWVVGRKMDQLRRQHTRLMNQFKTDNGEFQQALHQLLSFSNANGMFPLLTLPNDLRRLTGHIQSSGREWEIHFGIPEKLIIEGNCPLEIKDRLLIVVTHLTF